MVPRATPRAWASPFCSPCRPGRAWRRGPRHTRPAWRTSALPRPPCAGEQRPDAHSGRTARRADGAMCQGRPGWPSTPWNAIRSDPVMMALREAMAWEWRVPCPGLSGEPCSVTRQLRKDTFPSSKGRRAFCLQTGLAWLPLRSSYAPYLRAHCGTCVSASHGPRGETVCGRCQQTCKSQSWALDEGPRPGPKHDLPSSFELHGRSKRTQCPHASQTQPLGFRVTLSGSFFRHKPLLRRSLGMHRWNKHCTARVGTGLRKVSWTKKTEGQRERQHSTST